MKKSIIILLTLLLTSCTVKKKQDLSTLPWVDEFQYTKEEIQSVKTTGRIPGPKVPVTVENITNNCIIDIGTYDFILSEKHYDLENFNPNRIVNRQVSTRDMLLEEGMLDEVDILTLDSLDVFVYLMKKCDGPDQFAGLIGWHFFQDKLLTIDLKSKLVGIKACADIQRKDIEFFTGTNPSEKNTMLKFKGAINNHPVVMSVSTSLRHSQISPEFLDMIGITSRQKYVTLDSVSIGEHLLTEVTCLVNNDLVLLEPEFRDPIDFILGLNDIKDFILTVNFCNNQIYLDKASPKKVPEPNN